jgi:aminoglycoside 3-N-acetyltransferase I
MEKPFQIQRLREEDAILFRQLIAVFQEVFEMKNTATPNDVYLLKLLADPAFYAYIIKIENEIVGGLTAYELANYYSESSEMFIYDMAVKTAFQHKGLGKQLIQSLKEYCLSNNIGTMFVAAQEADQHAIEFYHSTGGTAEKVIHFNYNLGDDGKKE